MYSRLVMYYVLYLHTGHNLQQTPINKPMVLSLLLLPSSIFLSLLLPPSLGIFAFLPMAVCFPLRKVFFVFRLPCAIQVKTGLLAMDVYNNQE